jgi:hypothetical protein
MEQIRAFVDERLEGWCVFCGGADETRDHVPPRFFLDEPFPANYPVVPACRTCNNDHSGDEQYLGCLIECLKVNSTDPAVVTREKISRTLARVPSLRTLIESERVRNNPAIWYSQNSRIERCIVKIARGLMSYESGDPQLDDATRVGIWAVSEMTKQNHDAFFRVPDLIWFPEIGSRAFHRVAYLGEYGWVTVQQARFQYLASGTSVRMLFSNYLGAEVSWE